MSCLLVNDVKIARNVNASGFLLCPPPPDGEQWPLILLQFEDIYIVCKIQGSKLATAEHNRKKLYKADLHLL